MSDQGGIVTERQRPLVLIADDDDDILELVRVRLARSGFDLHVAHDGAEALALARKHVPDLALLDVSMPGLDGYEVAAALRRDPATAQVRVVMLTARAQSRDVAHGFAAGADDYITKPFSPQALQERVTELLSPAESRSLRPVPEP